MLLASAAAAENAELDEIVVVANKIGQPVRDVAANVSVVTRDELDANLAVSLADLFRYTPGVDYESAGTRFGSAGINIRGIGGNRVALLLDGVPLSDQFDVGTFSNATRDFLDAGLVERIEVLRGPASAMYGSAAIGGVIAVETPDPADIAGRNTGGGTLQTTWRASDDSLHGSTMLALDNGGKGVLLGGSLREGHEMASAAVSEPLDVLDFQRHSALAKLNIDDSRGGTWRFGLVHQDTTVASDLQALLGTGRYRSTTALQGHDDYQMQLANAAWEFGAPDALVDNGILRAYMQSTDIRQRTLDERGLAARPVAIDRDFRFEQQLRGIELNLSKLLVSHTVKHELGMGLEFRERQTEEYRDGVERGLTDGRVTSVILGEQFPLRDFPRSRSREWGAYLMDTMTIGSWSIIAALRADDYHLAPQDDAMFAEDYPFAEPVVISESDISPKLALLYHLRDNAEFYLQYSAGFRAPPYEHANIGLDIPAFNYRAVPNPDLESERSDGIELGMRWRGDRFQFNAAAFHTTYDNFIEPRVRIGVDPESGRILFQAQNVVDAVISGLELGARWQLPGRLEGFEIDGSLYSAYSEDKIRNQPLESVGPAQAILAAMWQAPDGRRTLRLQASISSAWNDRDESVEPLFKPDAYAVLDFYLTQRLGARTTLRVAILNLTDTTWWHWSSVRGLSPDEVLLPHLSQPGRNVSLSFGYDW
ncbi:MAG TPA: TonB-dependent receptor [Woeseiaceae bacterium]|nr:TonB-dependent receptor [Woeseiaceae bacterium]